MRTKIVPLHLGTGFVTPRRDAKGCVLPRALGGAEPISRGVGECGPVSDPPGPLVLPPTVSLRIAGDWRADHSRDVVDTEPKMTKALLIARGGFIPDENRILRPTDRPGRPPFLRPVGADQSRDEVRAASWECLRAAEQGYPARSTATRSGSAALKALLESSSTGSQGPNRCGPRQGSPLRSAEPLRGPGPGPHRPGKLRLRGSAGSCADRRKHRPRRGIGAGRARIVRYSSRRGIVSGTAQPQRHGAGCAAAPVSVPAVWVVTAVPAHDRELVRGKSRHCPSTAPASRWCHSWAPVDETPCSWTSPASGSGRRGRNGRQRRSVERPTPLFRRRLVQDSPGKPV